MVWLAFLKVEASSASSFDAFNAFNGSPAVSALAVLIIVLITSYFPVTSVCGAASEGLPLLRFPQLLSLMQGA